MMMIVMKNHNGDDKNDDKHDNNNNNNDDDKKCILAELEITASQRSMTKILVNRSEFLQLIHLIRSLTA